RTLLDEDDRLGLLEPRPLRQRGERDPDGASRHSLGVSRCDRLSGFRRLGLHHRRNHHDRRRMDRERGRESLTGGQVCILGLIILHLSSKIASKLTLPRRAASQSSVLIRRIPENSCTFRENIFYAPNRYSVKICSVSENPWFQFRVS